MRVLLILVLAWPLGAADWYWASVGALSAATSADYVSSIGKYEANPLMRGRDGRFSPVKGAIVKGGSAVALVYVERRMSTRSRRIAAIVNFALVGVFSAVAARNARIR